MNCKKAKELIPLQAGRDLDEQRALLLNEHLKACAACADVAEESRHLVELTRQFHAPVFTDEVYARVRRQVLNQIENEPASPVQLFAGWFQPRLAWTVASLLMISFGFIAVYLISSKRAAIEPVGNQRPPIGREEPAPGKAVSPPAPGPVNFVHASKPAPPKRKIVHSSVNQLPLVATKADSSASGTSATSLKPDAPNSLPAGDAGPSDSPLRVEIQTKDPNIRIIWFAQRENKRAVSNSKGT